jgi:nitroreductase
MDVLEAIYHRRAVRDFTEAEVHPDLVADLLRAAVQAPSAENRQPWAFAVIRGRERLQPYSERAKSYLLAILPQSLSLHQRTDDLAGESYQLFHGAGTLIVIYARPMPHHPAEDCCLAAQNLMLAAHAAGLGTCPVGFVRPWLNLPEIKRELMVPPHYEAVMPIVAGWPAGTPPAPSREEPDVIRWIDDAAQARRRFPFDPERGSAAPF